MKIEDIVTDKEGLKKIIDFLHSEGNFVKSGGTGYQQAFCLEEAKVKSPHINYGVTATANILYVVSLDGSEQPHPSQEQIQQVLGLIGEVYKG